MDRINIGFASLSMNKDLRLTATQFGLANTIFYLGYILCEIPSNLMLARYGARLWLPRISDHVGPGVGSNHVRDQRR